jgi:hypothetical protein
MNRCMTFSLFLALPTAVVINPAFAQSRCEDLTKLRLTNATVTSATSFAAGAFKPPTDPYLSRLRGDMPAFCRVAGVAKPTSDSEIKFEVWLPAFVWNGKYEQVGNGGLAGTIPLPAMAEPLLRGYAVAGTDDGHDAVFTDASWALGHPEKVVDFGYRAVHQTAIQAKAIVQAFYGKDPAQAYFVGCSDGGREALMEGERFPADFHGIIAGAPANDWTHLMFKFVRDEQTLRSDPGKYIPADKLAVLQSATLAACDRLDGVKDGLVENPGQCRFDPAVIQCKDADGTTCLTAAQVEMARSIYGPLRNSRTGTLLSPGFSPGAEAIPGNWAVWILGPKAGEPSLQAAIANSSFADLVFEKPTWDFRTLNFDQDVTFADDKLAAILNSTNPDLHAFKERGGKLIQYHGWADSAIPPQESIGYFESAQAANGSTSDFYRLFMVPGMSHCGNGAGASAFGNSVVVPQPDALHDVGMALDEWVAHGVAPDQIIGTGFVDGDPAKGVVMTRLLCPYPQQAHYKGTGDINIAASFTCQASPGSK